MRSLRWCSALLIALLVSPGSAFAGFWDEGLTTGAVRSEYGPTFFDTNYGTASDPLQIDFCPYGPTIYDCDRVFPSANAYSDWGGATATNFWVAIMNNELWHDPGSDPSVGPPNAGLPIGLPGSGQVAGLKVYPGSQKVRLSLDHRNPNPHQLGQAALPFLAFGADRDRGNGGPILIMDNDPDYFRAVGWDMKIEAASPGTCEDEVPNHVEWAAIQAFSRWNGIDRAFYLTLYAGGVRRSDTNGDGQVTCADGTTPFEPPGHAPERIDVDNELNGLWDWPIRRSLYYPGAEFFVVDPAWLASNCTASWPWPTRHPGPGTTKSYVVDVEEIFRCLNRKGYWSDPMPLSVTLDGFWWIAELTGQDARVQYTVTNPRTFDVCTGCQPF